MHKPFFNIAALTNAVYPLRVNKFSFVIVEPLPPQKGCGHHRDEDKTVSVTYSYSSTSSEFLLLYFFIHILLRVSHQQHVVYSIINSVLRTLSIYAMLS